MIHNIIPGLAHLATPIELVRSLTDNPWEGDVEAMRISLRTLGQHRVLIANGNPEQGGEATLGNHMLLAARAEGWTHLAVAWTDDDAATVKARAIVDNKMQSLGSVKDDIIVRWTSEAEEFYPVFEAIGYDDFVIAEMEEAGFDYSETGRGYIAPQLIDRDADEGVVSTEESVTYFDSDVSRGTHDTTPREASSEDAAVRGVGSTDEKRKAVVNFTLVFSDADQQRRWYDFMKFLKRDTDGESTTADLLMAFLESKADF